MICHSNPVLVGLDDAGGNRESSASCAARIAPRSGDNLETFRFGRTVMG